MGFVKRRNMNDNQQLIVILLMLIIYIRGFVLILTNKNGGDR